MIGSLEVGLIGSRLGRSAEEGTTSLLIKLTYCLRNLF
jgi:hypothetical protein